MAVPTPVITVTKNNASRSVVILVSAAAGDIVSVYRTVGGIQYPVRGASRVTMNRNSIILADFEVPQNMPMSYHATVEAQGVTASSVEQTLPAFDFGSDIIFDLMKPWDNMKVYVESFRATEHGIQRDVVNVWDRPDPIVVSGTRQLPSGTMNMLTLTLEDRTKFLDVIRSGNIIAFSPWKPEYGMESLTYFSVGNVTEDRPSPLAQEPSRRWILELQQVRQPASLPLKPAGAVTWADAKVNFLTWKALKDTGKPWFEIAGY